jgi:hypothetical protein
MAKNCLQVEQIIGCAEAPHLSRRFETDRENCGRQETNLQVIANARLPGVPANHRAFSNRELVPDVSCV